MGLRGGTRAREEDEEASPRRSAGQRVHGRGEVQEQTVEGRTTTKGTTQLRIVMINTGGAPGTWRALDAFGEKWAEADAESGLEDDHGARGGNASDIILMLDTQLTLGEAAGLKASAATRGYKMYTCEGKTTSKRSAQTKLGGVACMVKKNLSQKWIHGAASDNAQLLAVKICGWYVLCSYAPPTGAR